MNLPPSGSFQRRLLAIVLGERAVLGRILVASGLEALFALAGPVLVKLAIDEALPNQAPALLALVASLGLLAAIYTAWSAWLHQRTTILLRHHLELACLRDVLRLLLGTPFQVLQKRDFGSTSESMAAVSATVQTTVHSCVSMLAHGASGLGSLFLLMFWFPGLALLTASITLCSAMLALVYTSREAALSGAALRISSEQQELMHVALSSLPALRAAGATERVLGRHTSLLSRHALASVQQDGARLARDLVLRVGEDCLSLLTLGWLAYHALAGAVSIGELMTASLLGANFTRAAKNLADLGLSLRVMEPHFARIDALLAAASPSLPARGAAPGVRLVSREPRIALAGVWFRYDPSSPYVLKDYSHEFPADQVSRLEAESGFGKTTILRLLSGLLVPEHGRVSVLGHDPAASKDWVAYLPQQSSLFEASIAFNLKAISGESLERVLEIAELTGLSRLLEQLPMGVETPVSAGGGNLSAGQQQLIRLTAVFASRCPVVLLDEPTSRLDDAAKARIDWPRLVRDRTVVLVEHAVSRSVSSLQSFPRAAPEGVRFGGVR